MKVVLAEFDKGLILERKEKLFSRKLSKKYPGKDFRGGRKVSENILEKILRADGQFPKISWKRF